MGCDARLGMRGRWNERHQGRVDDDVGQVVARLRIEGPPAGDQLQRAVAVRCVDRLIGKFALRYIVVEVTLNWAVTPSAKLTSTMSPATNDCNLKNTAGPDWESTWPRITAEPISPGDGPSPYQPGCWAFVGTCTVPSALSPSVDNETVSERSGIFNSTGVERAVARMATFAGAGAALALTALGTRRDGTGRAKGCRCSCRPRMRHPDPTSTNAAAISPHLRDGCRKPATHALGFMESHWCLALRRSDVGGWQRSTPVPLQRVRAPLRT